MKKYMISILMLALSAILSVGCTDQLPEKIDIRGEITKVSEVNDKGTVGVILVEGELEKDTQVDKAAVTVTDRTKIYVVKNQNKIEKANFSVLQIDEEVEVTFSGPVRESYPVQATAETIVIIPGTEKSKDTPENKDTYESKYDGVELEMDKTVYNVGEVMDFTIVNASKSMISFGRPYMIEQYKDEKWTEYPLEIAFTMELILLEPGQSFNQPISLDDFEPGKYRVIKKIQKEEGNEDFKIAKEFEIIQ